MTLTSSIAYKPNLRFGNDLKNNDDAFYAKAKENVEKHLKKEEDKQAKVQRNKESLEIYRAVREDIDKEIKAAVESLKKDKNAVPLAQLHSRLRNKSALKSDPKLATLSGRRKRKLDGLYESTSREILARLDSKGYYGDAKDIFQVLSSLPKQASDKITLDTLEEFKKILGKRIKNGNSDLKKNLKKVGTGTVLIGGLFFLFPVTAPVLVSLAIADRVRKVWSGKHIYPFRQRDPLSIGFID